MICYSVSFNYNFTPTDMLYFIVFFLFGILLKRLDGLEEFTLQPQFSNTISYYKNNNFEANGCITCKTSHHAMPCNHIQGMQKLCNVLYPFTKYIHPQVNANPLFEVAKYIYKT